MFARIRSGLSTVRELISSMWNGPYWWLVPVVLVLLPLAMILVALQAQPLVAPFVYAAF